MKRIIDSSDLIRKLQFNLEDASRYKGSAIPVTNSVSAIVEEKKKFSNSVKETVFENNPYLVQQLDKLLEEKNISDKELDRAKLDVKDREDEIARLRGLIDKLRNGIDNFKPNFGEDSLPDQKNIKEYYMGLQTDMVDRIISFRNNQASKQIKELSFRVLFLNRLLQKTIKKYEKDNLLRLDAIALADIKNPLQVWNQHRIRLIHYLFEVFMRSRDESMKFKKNSYLLFKINIEDVIKNQNELLLINVVIYRL